MLITIGSFLGLPWKCACAHISSTATYTMLAYASFVYCGFALRQALHEIVQIINVQRIAELRLLGGRLIVVDALLDLRLLAFQFLLLVQLCRLTEMRVPRR